MIETLRKSEPVVLVDCGGLFDATSRDKAEVLLTAMEMMGYDALNLGGPEFFYGADFLAHARAHVSFPYIASNLSPGGTRVAGARQYVIKEAGGLKIAILGVVPPEEIDLVPGRARMGGLEALPPEPALKNLLAEVRAKADLVILLSRYDVEKTSALVQSLTGIDVAVSAGSDDVFYAKPLEHTVLLQTGSQGRTLGLLKIARDGKGVRVVDRGHIRLDRTVPDHAGVARLVDGFKTTQQRRAAEAAERRDRELREGLRLSPQEFMEQYQKQQTETKKGEAR